MVSLDVRPPPRSARAGGRDGARPRWLILTGAAAAVLGAAVVMAVLSAITVLLWAAGPIASDGVSSTPFRGAASLWLMGQRGPLDSGTYELVLPPLVVTAAAAVLTARLAGWAARATSAHELTPAAVVGGGVVLGHVGVCGVAGWVSSRAGSGVDVLDAMRAGLVFALLCAVAGVAPQTWPWATARARIGTRVRTVARAAGFGALALGAGGALALVASLGFHHQNLSTIVGAVGGGISGLAGTTLLCLALAPNAVLWVVSLAAGPGFALGTDGGLSLTGEMHGGALPAMPLLAALPGAGPLPGYAWLLVAIPVAAGGVIGWFARPAEGTRGWREELITAAVSGTACGLAVGLLAGYSSGGAGGRLDDFGPNGMLLAGVLAVQLALAATTLAAGRIGWDHYGRRPKPSTASPSAFRAPRVRTPKFLTPAIPAPRIPTPTIPAPEIAAQQKAAPEPGGTPIEVVAASEVEDVPDPERPENQDDTQDLPVVAEDDARD